jgi:hypothetical protein
VQEREQVLVEHLGQVYFGTDMRQIVQRLERSGSAIVRFVVVVGSSRLRK